MTQRHSSEAPRLAEGSPQSPKISQRLIDFAKPLTDAVGAADFHTVKRCMEVAAMCWNAAPLAEAGDFTVETQLANIMRASPPAVRSALQQLLVDRVTRLGHDPLTVEVLVTHNPRGGAAITVAGLVPQSHLAGRNREDPSAAFRSSASPARVAVKIGPNELCTCGSGRKYKRCCRPGAVR